MKISRIFAGMSALALAASMTAVTAFADSEAAQPIDISEMPATLKNYNDTSIKFSTDMDLDAFVQPFAEVKDDGTGPYIENGTDESKVTLSVEELAGVPMLRVQTLDWNENSDPAGWGIPKIHFDMSKIFADQLDKLPEIFTIKIDFVTKAVGPFTNDEGEEAMVPGNFMGAINVQKYDEEKGAPGWDETGSFGEAEWTSEWGSYEVMVRNGLRDGSTYLNTSETQYLSIMKWSMPNQADYYIADIKFEDEYGDTIPVNLDLLKKGADPVVEDPTGGDDSQGGDNQGGNDSQGGSSEGGADAQGGDNASAGGSEGGSADGAASGDGSAAGSTDGSTDGTGSADGTGSSDGSASGSSDGKSDSTKDSSGSGSSSSGSGSSSSGSSSGSSSSGSSSGSASSGTGSSASGTGAASDATDTDADNSNTATGATAGLALAGIAIAGSIAIASKRK